MQIELINEIEFDEGVLEQMKAVIAGAVKHAAGIAELEDEFEVCLTVTDDEGINALNKEHRGVDAPTDVLSFPLLEFEYGEDSRDELEGNFEDASDGLEGDFEDAPDYLEEYDEFEEYRNPQSGRIMLGDIVVNMNRAKEQAVQYGHSLEREACYLCVHSVLHLFGYDHMKDDEKAQMRALEEEIMNGFGITR
jgi:probable rRNA maturation factor